MAPVITAALITLWPLADRASAQAAPDTAARTEIDIGPQPLAQALMHFSRMTGVQLFFSTDLVRGLTSPGAHGSLTRTEALGQLLAGSGLIHRFTNSSTVAIQKPTVDPVSTASTRSDVVLDTIAVDVQGAATALQNDGLARDGYRANILSTLGPLGATSIKDTPFTVSVVPRQLIENVQAQSPDDVFRINPYTRSLVPQVTGFSPMVSMRGFNTYDSAEDGLRRPYSFATSLEDKERIEVLTGLSGFLYGAAAPAGMINYVYKRPTLDRLNNVTLGTYGGGQAYVHGDFGGPIDDGGIAGYRLNIVKQGGPTVIDDQSIDRLLISSAFDWRISERLKLEFNAAHTNYITNVPSSYWMFSDGIPHGRAPDASKDWSQPWMRDAFDKTRLAARATYEANDALTLRLAYGHEWVNRDAGTGTLNAVRAPHQYYQDRIGTAESRDEYDAGQALAEIKFDTFLIQHKLTIGYHMYQDRSWLTPNYTYDTGWTGPYPITWPAHVPEPVLLLNAGRNDNYSLNRNQNVVIGDQIELTDQWSALLGITNSRIEAYSQDRTGRATAPAYDKSHWSPSASLLYKPASWLTLYGSFIEGFEQGGVAPDTALNRGAVMPPMVSRQYEVGAKALADDVLLTAALFDIEKAYEYTSTAGYYTQDGRQRHKGIEFTATGKATEAITVIGGVTLLNAEISGGDFDGKVPINVAGALAKLYAEYELPGLPGFFLTGGAYYTGRQWAESLNISRLKAYTTFDLGARYAGSILGNPLTLRVNVTNVADKNYWLNSYYLGAPRAVLVSAQMTF